LPGDRRQSAFFGSVSELEENQSKFIEELNVGMSAMGCSDYQAFAFAKGHRGLIALGLYGAQGNPK